MKKVTELFLVYPDNFPSYYSSLCDFFLELYELIPIDIHLNIIVNNNGAINILNGQVKREFKPILVKGFNDIWLRDFMGFVVNGHVIKSRFKPDYFSKINTPERLKEIHRFSNEVLDQLKIKRDGLNIVWDGGNLVTNGKIGFITDKILSDNLDYSEAEILSRIEYALNIKPILVPTSKHDTLGHIDGYMAFLEEDTICISSYPDLPFLKHENEYLFRLREIAREEKLEIIDIQDRPTMERCYVDGESIESAKGCYINFLKLNNTIILPKFDIGKINSSQYNSVNKEMLGGIGYEVRTIDCTKLSELGGVLHCISWEW